MFSSNTSAEALLKAVDLTESYVEQIARLFVRELGEEKVLLQVRDAIVKKKALWKNVVCILKIILAQAKERNTVTFDNFCAFHQNLLFSGDSNELAIGLVLARTFTDYPSWFASQFGSNAPYYKLLPMVSQQLAQFISCESAEWLKIHVQLLSGNSGASLHLCSIVNL